MAERTELECGCAYIKPGDAWYQVDACPEHDMDLGPRENLPGTDPGGG